MTGISLLSSDFWQDHYQLAIILHKERAEVAYLNSQFDYAEELIYLVIDQCNTNLEKAEIYNILIVMLTMMSKYDEAISAARQALSLFNIDLPDQDFTNALQNELITVRRLWKPEEISALLNQPEMTNLEMRAALTLLVSVDPAAYLNNAELYGIIAAKMAYLSIQYGPIAASAKGYTSYGIILSSVLEDYQAGYQFARLGLQIADRFHSASMKAKAANNIANLVQHWVIPMKEAEAINNEGYKAGLESGELQFAGYIALHQMVNFFVSGKIFSEILSVLSDYLKFTAKTKNLLAYHSILACQLPIYNLSDLSPNIREFATDCLTETDYIADCHQNYNFFALCNYLTYKAQVLYLYRDYQGALACLTEAQTLLPHLQGMITSAVNNFYSSLVLAALYPTVDQAEQINYQAQIQANQKQMKIWADNCPQNFLHKYLLVEAEIARVSGQEMTAVDLYDQGIELAQKHEYIQEEALGNELAAQFWLGKGKTEIADIYLKKAHHRYHLWGATAKVKDLEQNYLQLLTIKVNNSFRVRTQTTHTANGIDTGTTLDLATVMKASQAISGEIILDKLLISLMRIIIENAGAQFGYLILENQGQLTIEASGVIHEDHITALQSLPIENHLPVTLINYVARLKEDVVLANASRQENFINDPYIIAYQPQSILCTPLLHQGHLIGIVYLENNLTTGAFTAQRLEVIKLLSGQAVIALQNARLYQTLEDKVKERTAQLAEANEAIRCPEIYC